MTDPKEVADLVARLLAGPARTGDTEDGEYELFDIEDAAQTMVDAATTLEALSSELERVKGERDQALEAEDEAKDCFWAIYPEWLELSGKPGITTEAAQTALASIQAKGE